MGQPSTRTFQIYIDREANDPETTSLLVDHLHEIDEGLQKIDFSVSEEPLAEGEIGLDRLRYSAFGRGHKVEANVFTPLGTAPLPVKRKCFIYPDNPGWCGAQGAVTALLNEFLGQTLFNPRLELIPPLRILSCRRSKAGYSLKLAIEDLAMIDDTLPFVLVQDLGEGNYESAGERIEFLYWDQREDSKEPSVQTILFKQGVSLSVLTHYCTYPQQEARDRLLLVMWPDLPNDRIDFQHGFTNSTVSR